MGKKIRFPLKLAEGAEVRTLEELREHFDLQAILEYYKNGKLLTWLEDRYLEGEAEAIRALDETAPDFQQQLCAVFRVEYTGSAVDLDEIERRQERLKKLRTITDEAEFIQNIDKVAFDQEALADLLDAGAEKIYLCGEHFTVPASRKGITYVGIKNPTVHISGNVPEDVAESGIEFVEIMCDNWTHNIRAATNDDKNPCFASLEELREFLTSDGITNALTKTGHQKDLEDIRIMQIANQAHRDGGDQPVLGTIMKVEFGDGGNRCSVKNTLAETIPPLGRAIPNVGDPFKLWLLSYIGYEPQPYMIPNFADSRDQLISNRIFSTHYPTATQANGDGFPCDMNEIEQLIADRFLHRHLSEDHMAIFKHLVDYADLMLTRYNQYKFFAERASWTGMSKDFYGCVHEIRDHGWFNLPVPTEDEIRYYGK